LEADAHPIHPGRVVTEGFRLRKTPDNAPLRSLLEKDRARCDAEFCCSVFKECWNVPSKWQEPEPVKQCHRDESCEFVPQRAEGAGMPGLKFYSGTKNASSWAMRAWLALRAAGLQFEEEIVDIRRPQRFRNLARVAQFSPPAMVPVLCVDGVVISDSLAIMEYANDMCEGRLLPADSLLRGQARSLVAWQHSGLSGICGRISFESAFYPLKRKLATAELAECRRLFDWLERLLRASPGPFLFGAVSLADFALTPAVIRLTRHDVDLEAWHAVGEWASAILDHPLVAEWMREADAQPPVWLEDYLIPGASLQELADPTVG